MNVLVKCTSEETNVRLYSTQLIKRMIGSKPVRRIIAISCVAFSLSGGSIARYLHYAFGCKNNYRY